MPVRALVSSAHVARPATDSDIANLQRTSSRSFTNAEIVLLTEAGRDNIVIPSGSEILSTATRTEGQYEEALAEVLIQAAERHGILILYEPKISGRRYDFGLMINGTFTIIEPHSLGPEMDLRGNKKWFAKLAKFRELTKDDINMVVLPSPLRTEEIDSEYAHYFDESWILPRIGLYEEEKPRYIPIEADKVEWKRQVEPLVDDLIERQLYKSLSGSAIS